MNRGLSLYLDLVRVLAALGVVLSHARFSLLPGLPWAVTSHGSECVAVFFVLSGFVISFASVEKDEGHWRKYAAARLARIAPVALLSFVSTLAFTLVGLAAGDAFFFHVGYVSPLGEAFDLLKSALFLNEIWFTHSVFGTNEPYWSLGFEIPYYLLFALATFLQGRLRWMAVAGWFLVFGPKIAAFLPLWLLGVWLYHVVRAKREEPPRPVLGLALVACAAAWFYAIHKVLYSDDASIFKPKSLHMVLIAAGYFLLVGVCFAASIFGANMVLKDAGSQLAWVAGPIQWLAGGSFTLYLLHQPMMITVRALVPPELSAPTVGWVALALIIALCYALAELAERRKRGARRFVERWLPGRPRSQPA